MDVHLFMSSCWIFGYPFEFYISLCSPTWKLLNCSGRAPTISKLKSQMERRSLGNPISRKLCNGSKCTVEMSLFSVVMISVVVGFEDSTLALTLNCRVWSKCV